MKGTIKFGEMPVEMDANGASVIFFKEIFKEDFLVKSQEKNVDQADLFLRMGFVMMKQAEFNNSPSDMRSVSKDDYVIWLVGFSPMDTINAAGEIAELFNAQEQGTSIPKKEGG